MELFRYNDTPVRTILKDGEPWFVASDLAKILGYRDSERMTRRLDDDEKSVELLETATGVHTPKKGMYSHKRNHLVINESGLYNAILRSNVYNAKHFRKWVTNEVLPTLRKTGTYTTTPTTAPAISTDRIEEAKHLLDMCQAAVGLIHPDHLEAKARTILARAMGDLPELDHEHRPLYTQDFLKEKNLTKAAMKSVAGVFGKRLKTAYQDRYGKPPLKYPMALPNGQTREVNAYTEADRPLMEHIWNTHYNLEGITA